MIKRKTLLEAPFGEYVVLGVSWADMRIGKALHDHGLIYGATVHKHADNTIVIDDVQYGLPDNMLAAVSVLTADEFYEVMEKDSDDSFPADAE